MCVCVAFVSFSLYLSRSKTTCSQIGLVEKYPEPQLRKRRGKKIGLEELKEEIGLRKKKKSQRRLATWAWHAISDFCLFVFVSFFCFFLCQSLTFSLSLNPNPSSSLFWFMGFDSWVHGFDYLLRKSIKEKKILIILIF